MTTSHSVNDRRVLIGVMSCVLSLLIFIESASAVIVRVSRHSGGQNASSGQANVLIGGGPVVIGLVGNAPGFGGEQVTVDITNLGAIVCPGLINDCGIGGACTAGNATRYQVDTGPVLGFAVGDDLQIAVLFGTEVCRCNAAAGYMVFNGCLQNFFSARGPFAGNRTHTVDVLPTPRNPNAVGACCYIQQDLCVALEVDECADDNVRGKFRGVGTECTMSGGCPTKAIPASSELGTFLLCVIILAAVMITLRHRKVSVTV